MTIDRKPATDADEVHRQPAFGRFRLQGGPQRPAAGDDQHRGYARRAHRGQRRERTPRLFLRRQPATMHQQRVAGRRPFVIGATSFDLRYDQGFYGWLGDVRLTGRALDPRQFLQRTR